MHDGLGMYIRLCQSPKFNDVLTYNTYGTLANYVSVFRSDHEM